MKKNLKIVIANDHGGISTKNIALPILTEMGFTVKNMGTDDKLAVDYPLFAKKLAQQLPKFDFGILICGTGIGMSIAANRFPHVRAALCNSVIMAKFARLHNDANVLCLGGRVLGNLLVREIITTFFATDFSNENRHVTRINELGEL